MIHSLFPSYIFETSLVRSTSQLNKQLLSECYKFKDLDHQGQKWSAKNYPGGYTSYGSMTNMYDRSLYFNQLKTKINKHVASYVKSLEMDIDANELKMSSLWINIMPPGVTHPMHIHPLSVISGTYYVQVPKGASSLKFEDPRMVHFMASPPRKAKATLDNQRFVHMNPKEGSILLFESWIRHEVPPNAAKKDRVSISFNYDWCG